MGEMTARQVIERERECVARQQCDRNCAQCDLVMEADDILTAYDHALDFLEAEERTGMTPEDVATIGRFREHIFSSWSYDRMVKIAKADSEDRLVVLPCKVGDTVYRLSAGCCDLREKDCCSAYCDGYDYSCPSYEADTLVEIGHFCLNDLTSLGKTVFLALEDANAARAKEASS